MTYRFGASVAAVAIAAAATAAIIHGASKNFAPDAVFTGSSLTGWQPIGQSTWRAENGEIIGTPTAAAGGWLLANKPYQDVAVFASFRCAAGCQTGVMVRAEKTADGGVKGVFVSLNEGDLAAYRVTLDRQGAQTSKERLRGPGGGQLRVALPPPESSAGCRRPRAGSACTAAVSRRHRVADSAPDDRPARGDWNTIELVLDANILRAFLNDAGGIGDSVAETEYGAYGPFALYVGGTGEVRFKDVSHKDLHPRVARARTGVEQVPDADAERVLLLVGSCHRRLQSRRNARHRRRSLLLPRARSTRRLAKSTSAERSIRERSTSTACSTPTTSRATDGPTS